MRFVCRDMERFGKGVGNAARAQIVEQLLNGSKTVSELTEAVGLSQSAVSQHLAKLKSCSLVTDERRGQEVFYTLNVHHVLGMLATMIHRARSHTKTPKVTA